MRMNRTSLLLALAGALGLLALVTAPDVPAPEPVFAPQAQAQPTGAPGEVQLVGRLASAFAANAGAPNYLTLQVAAGAQEPTSDRLPSNLVVVIDRSGSMRGRKLADARAAARALVDALGSSDRLAIVHYGSDVVTMPSTLADAEGRERLRAFVDGIVDQGGTHISGALQAAAVAARAHQEAYRTNRIILLSDGQPTEGILHIDGLAAEVSRLREQGFTVTSLGVGEDFDEQMMRTLAEHGGGFYGYLGDSHRLADVFARELNQAGRMVARDVELHLQTPAGVRVEEVLGRRLLRDGQQTRVRLYDLSAGLSERMVVRFSVDAPAGTRLQAALTAQLTWTDMRTGQRRAAAVSLPATVTADARRALENADAEVMAHAANAEAARHVREAAALARQGRGAEADRMLGGSMDNLRKLFGSSANALAGETIESSQRALRSGDMNRAAKEMDRRSMGNFGQNNSY
jgi:Ca-activated chloride channel homolog